MGTAGISKEAEAGPENSAKGVSRAGSTEGGVWCLLCGPMGEQVSGARVLGCGRSEMGKVGC